MEFGILVAVETILRKMTTFKESAAIGLVTSYLRVLSFALLLLMLYSVFLQVLCRTLFLFLYCKTSKSRSIIGSYF